MSDQQAEGRAKRESVFRTAVLTLPTHRSPIECRVRNVSETGACVSHRGELMPGMEIVIAVAKAPEVRASVAWATNTLAGIAFDNGDISRATGEQAGAKGVHAGWLVNIHDAYRK